MTFYVTKYALTSGILVVDGEISEEFPGMLAVTNATTSWGYFHGEGVEWFRTLGEAQQRAEAMRARKLTSLRAQIARLEKMVIKVLEQQ